MAMTRPPASPPGQGGNLPTGQGSGQTPPPGKFHGHVKWARFGKIPVGYKTMRVPGQSVDGHWAPAHTARVVKYAEGGWVKVGSPRYRKIVSYIGEHGHQAAIPKQYVYGKIRPDLRPVSHTLPKSAQTKGSGNETAGRNASGGRTQTTGPVTNPIGNQGPKPPKNPKGTNPKTAAANAKTLGQGIGSANVGQMTPLKDAVAQANLQFGAQIKDTRLAQAEGQAQHAQNLHDIQQWYKQIGDVNAAAQQANQGAVKQEVQSDQGNMLAALRAIGGSANAGAGAVAAAGLNAQGLAQGLGQSQDAFSNLIQGALGGAQAGQMSAQSALDSQAARSLQQQLSDLQGQRGDAIVTNQDAIRAANNSLAQTRFGDRISKQQAIQAGVALAGSLRLQAQQTTGQALQNTIAGQQAGVYPTTGNNGQANHTAWAMLKPADKYGAVTSAIKALGPSWTPQKVAVMLQQMGGWAPVHTLQFINTFHQ